MVALSGKSADSVDQIAGRELHSLAVCRVRHDANRAIFGQGAAGPTIAAVCSPLCVGPIVKHVIRIKKRDNKINVRQRPHGSNSLLLDQPLNMAESHYFAACFEEGNAPTDFLGFSRIVRWDPQAPSRETGDNLAGGASLTLSQFFGGLQHIFFDIQDGSHASDDIASPY